MSAPERGLLLGLLAVRVHFLSRTSLFEALPAWSADTSRDLAEILQERGLLSTDRLRLLEDLVAAYLESHDGSASRGLAALSTAADARELLREVPDDATLRAVLSSWPEPVGRTSTRTGDGTGTGRETVDHVDAVGEPTTAPLGPDGGPTPVEDAGRYQVLRRHAHGGLGEVFVAVDTAFHREVALKEMRPQPARDPANIGRFLREAEVTGRLEHPGVVPVYGRGAHADGRPFYVMRFIHGDNLLEALQRFHAAPTDPVRRNVELRALLRRFVDVCNVIAYAHNRGVLHRDLKPSNIMLGPFGETLVVDWGLAKVVGGTEDVVALAPLSGEAGPETEAGQALGTPAYMAPEQAEGRLTDLGPAADVYSLGATLYALLTGVPPLRGEVSAVLRRVRRGDFPRPRTVRPEVPPALEAVCLRAMALRPNDRYPGALELAADVERWLADEPVAVWRESAVARLARWGRRHQARVAALAALLATGLVVTSAAALLLHQEQARTAAAFVQVRDEEARTAGAFREAEAARERAVRATTHAGGALDRLTDSVVADLLGRRPRLTGRDRQFVQRVLRDHEEYAELLSDASAAAALLARAHFRVGLIRERLGDGAGAGTALRRAAGLVRGLPVGDPGLPPGEQAMVLSSLGTHCLRRGLLDEAEALFHEALAACPTDGGAGAPGRGADLRATVCFDLALLHGERGRYRDADASFAEAIALRRGLLTAAPLHSFHHNSLVRYLTGHGAALYGRSRSAEAEPVLAEAVCLARGPAAAAPDDPEAAAAVAGALGNHGLALAALGRRPEAEAALREAMERRERLAAAYPSIPGYQHDLARARVNLSNQLSRAGQRDRAGELLAAARAAFDRLAQEQPTVVDYRVDLGKTLLNAGHDLRAVGSYQEAEKLWRRGLEVWSGLVAEVPDVPEYASQLARLRNDLAVLLGSGERAEEAERLLGEALDGWKRLAERHPGERHHRREEANAWATLGTLYGVTGRPERAEEAFARMQTLRRGLATDDPRSFTARNDLARGCNNYGNFRLRRGQLREGETLLSEAVAAREQLVREYPTDTGVRRDLGTNLSNLGSIRMAQERWVEAEPPLVRARDLLAALAAEQPRLPQLQVLLGRARLALGQVRREVGRGSEAVGDLQEAAAAFRRLVVAYPSMADHQNDLASALVAWGLTESGQGRLKEARALLTEAAPHHEAARRTNPRHPDYLRVWSENRQLHGHLLAAEGRHTAAAAAAQELAELKIRPKQELLAAVRILAKCVVLAEADTALTETERSARAAAYAGQAAEYQKRVRE